MAVLLLRFDAPLQSWGVTEKLKDHHTDLVPSKSGVIGMIASAEGRKRDEDISDLVDLRFGVRIDEEGEIIGDYHISIVGGSFGETKDLYGNGHLVDTINRKTRTKLGTRYYLAGAVFTCGIEGDRDRLEEIKDALIHPANILFLGRRCCPVTANLIQGVVNESLYNALSDGSGHRGFIDVSDDSSDGKFRMVKDTPVSFNPEQRKYALRKCKEVRF